MRRNKLYKFVACVTLITQVFYPVVGPLNAAFAANPYNADIQGITATHEDRIWSDASYSGGNIKIGDIEDEMGDIFPGINDPDAAPADSLSEGELTDAHGDADAMKSIGLAAQDSLDEDSNSADPSVYGSAYGAFTESGSKPKVDLSNDPMFNNVRDANENASVFEDNFFSCSSNDELVQSNRPAHIPDYKTCNRIKEMDGSCELEHDYDVSFISHHDGPYNLAACESGDCINLWIGEVGDNYWSGNCSIYEEYTRVKVDNPDAVKKATLEYTKYDDYMQVWVGEPGREELVWSGPDGNFPPETEGQCELKTSWESSPGVDLTSLFRDVEPGTVISFKIRVSVSGEGEGFGRINLEFDREEVIINDHWEPASCATTIEALDDGYAKGSYTCLDDPASGSGGCAVIDGVPVCPDALSPSPSPGIPNTCRLVEVDATLDFWKGDMDCWTDPQGEQHCHTIENEFVSDCPALESQGCGFIKQLCVEGSRGPSGTCYVTEEVWDCGREVEIESNVVETEYTCEGDFQCIGPDCFDTSVDHNTDFAKASALLNMAQSAQQDMDCVVPENNDENVTCEVFSGESMECKEALGGTQDCCDQPVGISARDYLTMIMAVPKLDAALIAASDAGTAILGPIGSGYETLRTPVVNAAKTVAEPFTSFVDNAVNAIKEPVQKALSELVSMLKEQVAKVTESLVTSLGGSGAGEAAGAAAADAVGDQALQEGATQLMGFAQMLYGIYAYYAIAMAIIKIVWKCEEEEFMLAAQKEFGNCTYIGSYCKTEALGVCIEKRTSSCCFKSPMARIMQEQIREQVGMDWGTAKSPSCGGVPLEKLQMVDWDQVNLDEWTAILSENGLYQGAADNLTMDALTGSGNVLGGNAETGEERLDVYERTQERTEGIDFDERKQELREQYPLNN